MESTFDLKKFLVENKLTTNSRMLSENGTYQQQEILKGAPNGFKSPDPAEFKVNVMVTPNKHYGSQEELNQQMGRVTAVSPDKITYKKGDGKLYNSDPADLIIVAGVAETQSAKPVDELFGFGKKSQFKPGQKVTYTSSNANSNYNGDYIVGKVLSNGELGIYEPDSPMKKVIINAKPEELKLVENKLTASSKMINENTSVVFQMVVPPGMVEYMLDLEPTLTSDEIENVFMNYLLSLMEENPIDEYLEDADVVGGTGNSLRDLAADVY